MPGQLSLPLSVNPREANSLFVLLRRFGFIDYFLFLTLYIENAQQDSQGQQDDQRVNSVEIIERFGSVSV